MGEARLYRARRMRHKKISFESLVAAFPARHMKLLASLRKDMEKKAALKKKKALQQQQQTAAVSSSSMSTGSKKRGSSSAPVEEDTNNVEDDLNNPESMGRKALDKWEDCDEGMESGNRRKARRLNREAEKVLEMAEREAENLAGTAAAGGASSSSKKVSSAWLREGADGEVTDLSSAQALAKSVVAGGFGKIGGGATGSNNNATGSSSNKNTEADAKRNADAGLIFAPDGKMVVREEGEESDSDDEGGRFTQGGSTGSKAKSLGALKSIREEREERKKQKARAKNSHAVRGLMHYDTQKNGARGDAKRKGQALDPYAYVSLNPRLMREKHRDKAIRSFKEVVGKAPERGAKAKKIAPKKVKKTGEKRRIRKDKR